MRKRIAIGMLLLLGLGACLTVFRVLFSNEPKYHGKRLSGWFKQYYRSGIHVLAPDEIDLKDATAALRAIGTNAVPWLVGRCFDLDPDWVLRAKVQPILHEKLRFPLMWILSQFRGALRGYSKRSDPRPIWYSRL